MTIGLAATIAFLAGFVTAGVEILSRYSDEPFKTVLSSRFGWFYLFLNAVLGVAAYLVLVESADEPSTLGHVGWALTGGLGAATVIRARVFSARVGDEEVAIGPGYVVDQLLAILDRHIDRNRASTRTKIVLETMEGISFEKAKNYASTMILGSMQNLSLQDEKNLAHKIQVVKDLPTRDQEKALALGFIVLDFMGEDFLRKLFTGPQRQALEAGTPDTLIAEPDIAVENADLVRTGLAEVSFSEARRRFEALAGNADPPLSAEEHQDLLDEVHEIELRDIPEQDQSHALGFLVFDFFGRSTFEEAFPPSQDTALVKTS